jgi:hypothetical protein
MHLYCGARLGGLGDQLTDMLGAIVISQLMNASLTWKWINTPQNHYVHGDLIYDHRLFDLHSAK